VEPLPDDDAFLMEEMPSGEVGARAAGGEGLKKPRRARCRARSSSSVLAGGVQTIHNPNSTPPHPPRPTQVTCPGAHRTICVQLRLHHLAVAALLKAQDLAEMEGATGLDGLGAGAPAFGVLRRLAEVRGSRGGQAIRWPLLGRVCGALHPSAPNLHPRRSRPRPRRPQSWLNDATRNQNPIADRLLQNLYRWVSNPAGRLHDQGLQRALLGLMQRLFLALVADMRRLGATLISANFQGVLICTGKRNMSAAGEARRAARGVRAACGERSMSQPPSSWATRRHHPPTRPPRPAPAPKVGYVRYLLDTLAKRDLFSWLTLAPSRWWHCLLYRDAYNWGGVEAALPAGLWEAMERWRSDGGGGGPGADEEAELEAMDRVDPTQIGTPGGPKLRWAWVGLD
jgi:DNA polymerase epsilon subunit 1